MSSSSSESSEDDTVTIFRKKNEQSIASRKRARISVSTKSTNNDCQPPPKVPITDVETFEDLSLSPWLVSVCKSLNMKSPTEIQRQCVIPTLLGKNIIASAPTGSGKTAAFALPILQKLATERYGVFAVVVTPTRELAFQINDQFQALGNPINVNSSVIVGGLALIEQQIELKRNPHVVIGTPGRIAAHLNMADPPNLKRVSFLVLDEADRLLESGFAKDLKVIFKALPTSRQTLLYSATLTSALDKIKRTNNGKEVFEFHARKEATTPGALDERYILIAHQVKIVYLAYVFRRFGPEANTKLSMVDKKKKRKRENSDYAFDQQRAKLMIIFVSSCKSCALVGETLADLGIKVSTLHSGLSQSKRLASLGKFRSRVTNVLVATDVASRGLDIPHVDMVVNYDIPRSVEDYVHRVGRTARAGRTGLAISFVTQYDVELLLAVEKSIGKTLLKLPDVDEENDVLVLLNRVTNSMKKAKLALAARK